MREVSSVFQEGLLTGLMVDPALNTQAQHLLQCYNLVPGPYGLEARQDINNPIPTLVGQPYPWPALFSLSRYTLIFTEREVYLADKSWNLNLLHRAEWGTLPHVADFMDTVVWSSQKGQWIMSGGRMVDELKGATFKTCCAFRGQLLIGNATLPNGPTRLGDGSISFDTEVSGESIVAWSKIGSLEWEFTLGNEVGWAPMPWDGPVLAMLPLGKEVVVYGQNGIVKLAMTTSPVQTFGIQDFGDVGIFNETCVAGDFTSHLFLGTDYNLYMVEPEKALSGEGKLPRRLGYRTWMQTLTDPIITFDPTFRHWWIGDQNRCFIFSGKGLGESSITPTHLSRFDGPLWGFYHTHGGDEAIVQTGPLSFDHRGIKTLMNVEADVESQGLLTGQVSWKSAYNHPFRDAQTKRLDPRGSFFPIVAGTEFLIKISSTQFRNFLLSKMWLHHKNTDKHFSRGVINAGRPTE